MRELTSLASKIRKASFEREKAILNIVVMLIDAFSESGKCVEFTTQHTIQKQLYNYLFQLADHGVKIFCPSR